MGFTRKHALPCVVLGFLLLIAFGCWIKVLAHLATQKTPPNAAHSSVVTLKPQTALGAAPLRFEPNVGQSATSYDFLCRTPRVNLFTRPTQATLVLRAATSAGGGEAQTVRMRLLGANADAPVSGDVLLPSRSHYFVGSDAERSRRDVPNYAGIRYTGVYPNVDLHYYGRDGQLEYDFELAPWANPDQVRLRFDGPRKVALAEDGSLRLILDGGEARQHPPVAYQMEGTKRKLVQVAYRVEDRQVGFNLGEYDHSRPLIIDPIITVRLSDERTPGSPTVASHRAFRSRSCIPATECLLSLHSKRRLPDCL